MDNSSLRASFHTLGCRLNQAETALIANRFRDNGYRIVDFGEHADVCVINTCTVTDQADAKCRQAVRQTLRNNPDTYVAVVGCYAQTGTQALSKIDGVDLIVGSQDKLDVLNYIDAPVKNDSPAIIKTKFSRQPFTIEPSLAKLPTTRANLKIQDGCDFMCSFCLIPFARGRARSRAFWDIQREAQQLVDSGYQELVLTGVNIGTYRFEEKGFLDVVKMLLKIPALERLRISSIEPTTIPEEILHLMADSDKLCPHLHIPLQSGDDGVLNRMKRLYTRREFLDFIEKAERIVPDVLIGTDVIVGFPGEDDAAFEESCRVMQDSPMAYAHVFTYSQRKGTAATRLDSHVEARIKKERRKRLQRISDEEKKRFYAKFIGRKLRVLVEERDRHERWTGFSDNYIKVAFENAELTSNEFVSATLGAVEDGAAIGDISKEEFVQ